MKKWRSVDRRDLTNGRLYSFVSTDGITLICNCSDKDWIVGEELTTNALKGKFCW